MKLSSFLFSVFFLTAISTKAQIVPGFQFGLKGGANLNKIDGRSFKDEFELGYHAGAFAVIKFSNAIQLQPEVLFNEFTTQAADEFNDITNVSNLKEVKLNYLSIPLLLNLTPTKFLSFQVGPQYGILLNKSDHLVEAGKNAFKNGDFSMIGGAQLNIGKIKLSGRYIIGLSDIGDLPDRNDWKNQGFQLSVGFRII